MTKKEITLPVYHRIAVDIASRISDGQYEMEDKLYARSSIASYYGVSPETARRAIRVLADLDIVETEKGSGVIIKSMENAKQFIQTTGDFNSIHTLKDEIFAGVERQKREMETLITNLKEFADSTERFRNTNPFVPFRIEIKKNMAYLNKTTAEANFWHNTTATVVAIKRGDKIIISPGPYATFRENDVFYLIGDEDAYEKVKKFMYPVKK